MKANIFKTKWRINTAEKVLSFRPNKLRALVIFALLFLSFGLVKAEDEVISEFDQEISKLGFNSDDLVDWSNQKKINIDIPTCAYVNISGINALPPKKTSNYKAWIEFYDGAGNYFKKRIIINLQGKSSTKWPKTNYALDFCEDEWIGDKTPDIKFGNWVKQDAFHIKAYYLDKFRGTGTIGYKVYDMIISGRGERPWNRANLNKPDAEARCTPDGFPAIVYVNGDFYGVYAWQLKKHRKNYNIDKDNPFQIHLDGNLSDVNLFSTPTINWTSFEVRSPKSLYDMDGNKYDGDHPKELIDETSAYYDLESDDESVKEIKQNTAAVKHRIEQLRNHWFEIQDLISSGASKDEIRAEISNRFDVPSIIDYIIHNLLTCNLDGLKRNWQWFTYDGYKWFVAPYDLDATFGYHTNYFIVFPPENYATAPLSVRGWKTQKNPLALVHQYFLDDIYAYYAEIRDQGLLTSDGVVSLFDNWYYNIGEDNWSKEWEKWPDSPFTKETITNANWKEHEWDYTAYRKADEYDKNTTYNAGDICIMQYRLWEATGTTQGVPPFSQIGCPDDINRIHTWVPIHMSYLDQWMKYTPSAEMASYLLEIPASRWATVCLPFQFDIPSGLEVYNVTGFITETNTAKLEPVTEPIANKPYVIKGNPGRYQLMGEKEEGDATSPDYLVNGLLHGTYSAHTTASNEYLLQMHESKPGFYTAGDNTQGTVAPNSAYIVVNNTITKPEVIYLSTNDIIPEFVTVKISNAGFGTYCSNFGLDFANVEGIKAYVLYGFDKETSTVKMARVDEVPSQTGLLVSGKPGEYQIPTKESSLYLINMLIGTTEEIWLTQTDGTNTNFVLTSVNNSPSFARLQYDGHFAANKAYLPIPTYLLSTGTNNYGMTFDDDNVDGIESITDGQGNNSYYTTTGIKTDKPVKGIYIKDGKKYVIY